MSTQPTIQYPQHAPTARKTASARRYELRLVMSSGANCLNLLRSCGKTNEYARDRRRAPNDKFQ